MRGPEGMHCRLFPQAVCHSMHFIMKFFLLGFDSGTPSYLDYDELFYDDYSDDLEPNIAGDLGFDGKAMTGSFTFLKLFSFQMKSNISLKHLLFGYF